VPTNWNVIDAHGDYNGDGKSDILWRNSDDGMVALWQMNGTQIGAGAVLSTVPTDWNVIDAHGDYNGDGKSDILWRNSDDGMVALWQMNGTQIDTGAVLSTVPTNWRIVDGTESGASLTGDGSSNTLLGTINNDTLSGREDNDTLTGHAGADKFVFNTALDASTNVDTITDFASGTDKIVLDHLIFAALSVGNVAAGNFVSEASPVAHEADDHILYDTTNGNLSYDADGAGGQAATLFANIANYPALAAGDFGMV
jgi:Ca2+-binding RTX toxin-like protein